ncbi:MAG: MptD family putative ECF transporter S component [Bacillota bacterium]
MKNKLKTKDLIYAGAFAAVYIVVMFVAVMLLGFVPFLYLFVSPFAVGILGAIVYTMYILKVKKFGAITILGVLFGLVTTTGGHPYSIMLAIPLGLIADFICKIGNYESKKWIAISYMVFNITMIGPFMTLVVAKESFVESVVEYYGQAYGDAIAALATDALIFYQAGLAILGAALGMLLANKLLKKHFEKAGVV